MWTERETDNDALLVLPPRSAMAWDGESISAPDYGTGGFVPTIKFSRVSDMFFLQKEKRLEVATAWKREFCFPL